MTSKYATDQRARTQTSSHTKPAIDRQVDGSIGVRCRIRRPDLLDLVDMLERRLIVVVIDACGAG